MQRYKPDAHFTTLMRSRAAKQGHSQRHDVFIALSVFHGPNLNGKSHHNPLL